MGFASRGFGEAYYFEYLEFAPASICWYDRAMKKHSRNSDGREDIQGFKYFKVLAGLTGHLREAYRDPRHPNKSVLHYDQYIALILAYLFDPASGVLRRTARAVSGRLS